MNLDKFLLEMQELISTAKVYDDGDFLYGDRPKPERAYSRRVKALRLWIAQYGTADE